MNPESSLNGRRTRPVITHPLSTSSRNPKGVHSRTAIPSRNPIHADRHAKPAKTTLSIPQSPIHLHRDRCVDRRFTLNLSAFRVPNRHILKKSANNRCWSAQGIDRNASRGPDQGQICFWPDCMVILP